MPLLSLWAFMACYRVNFTITVSTSDNRTVRNSLLQMWRTSETPIQKARD
jgi:hypothetical protein